MPQVSLNLTLTARNVLLALVAADECAGVRFLGSLQKGLNWRLKRLIEHLAFCNISARVHARSR